MAVSFSHTSRALDADRGFGSRIAMWAGLLLLAAWAAWFFFGRVSVYEASKSAFVEVASASRMVSADKGGKLVASGIYVGRKVRAGEVIAELDAREEKLKLAAAEARLARFPEQIKAMQTALASTERARDGASGSASATVAAARARTQAAQADADFSGNLADRQRKDSEAGGIAPVDAERSATEARKLAAARDAARHEERIAASTALTATATRAADAASVASSLAGTEGDYAATLALVEQLRLDVEARQIRAPTDGVIGQVTPHRLGEMLPAGAKLATIVPAGDLKIVADFDATRGLGRISEGQQAKLRLSGFIWTEYGEFPARVAHVAAEASGGRLRVELLMPRRTDAAFQLRHGMAGQVDVLLEDVSPAILLLRALGQILA